MRPLLLAGSLCCAVAFAPAASPARRTRVCRGLAFEARAPCAVEVAEPLLENGEAAEGGTWVAAFPLEGGSLTLDSLALDARRDSLDVIRNSMAPAAMLVSPVERAPSAVGRLRRLDGGGMMIDCVRSSIPKEQADFLQAVEVCVDALVAEALKLCSADGEAADGLHFERLEAAADIHTARVFEQVGFEEVVEVDFSVLGAGGPIPTHRARLASAIAAVQKRVDSAPEDEAIVRRMAKMSLLSELLQQPPPPASPEQSAQTPSTNAWASLDASRLQGL